MWRASNIHECPEFVFQSPETSAPKTQTASFCISFAAFEWKFSFLKICPWNCIIETSSISPLKIHKCYFKMFIHGIRITFNAWYTIINEISWMNFITSYDLLDGLGIPLKMKKERRKGKRVSPRQAVGKKKRKKGAVSEKSLGRPKKIQPFDSPKN